MVSPVGRQVTLNAQFQSAFDTFPAAGTWQPLHTYDISAGETRGLEDDPILGTSLFNGRDPTEKAPSLPVAEGQIVAPMCLNQVGYWLKNAFGAPATTGAGADKTHTFRSGQDVIPALALEKKLKAGAFRRLRGAKVNTLAVRAEKAGGFPRMTLGMMARDEALQTVVVGGVISPAMTLLRPAAAKPVVRWDTVAIGACLAADLTYTNNLERLNFLGGDEYPGDLDPGPTMIAGTLTMRYQDDTWFDLARAGTTGRLELEWAISATKLITFDMPKVKLADKTIPITGPGAITVTFDFSGELTASADALSVILKNQIASY